MKRVVAFLVLLLGALWSAAQTPLILQLSNDTSYKNSYAWLKSEASFGIGTNALDVQFMKELTFGGHLSKAQIANRVDAISDVLYGGGRASGGMEVWSFSDTLFGKTGLGLKVQASANYSAQMMMGKELFQTIFQGNAPFYNDTAEFGKTYFNYQAFQKYGVGLFRKRDLSFVQLSLVNGENFQELDAREGQLFTSVLGDSLSLQYAGSFWSSDTSRSGYGAANGLGLCLDADYNVPLEKGKGFISVSVRDFGWIKWQNGLDYTFDSLSTWRGFDVNQLIDAEGDTTLSVNFRDSLHYQVNKKDFIKAMPMSVHLRMAKMISASNYANVGVSIWPGRALTPRVFAGLGHFIGDHFVVSEYISFGGYSKFSAGAELQWMPKGKWFLSVKSNNLPGWIFNDARSRDVQMAVSYFINRKN
ncbi:MAG: hypothetical protein RLZZ77_2103 [Bacteroidota bacterium]